MRCFDCGGRGETVDAVAVCHVCGAAVCHDCVRVGVQIIQHPSGFTGAAERSTEVRQLACRECAEVLVDKHAGRYRFTAPA